MKILLLCSTFNSLSQRLFAQLRADGHEVTVEIDAHEGLLHAALDTAKPDLVIAPYLRRAIPTSVLRRVRCLVVHPGPPGDGGPNALDHAVLDGVAEWGVTVLEATETLDGGPIHASRRFPMRFAPKSSLYADEVADAAAACLTEALERIEAGVAPDPAPPLVWRPRLADEARRVRFEHDSVDDILRKVHASDGMPGAPATILGVDLRISDARIEDTLAGRPGQVIAAREHALCLAARNGAVWIGHARPVSAAPGERPFKRALTTLLADRLGDVPRLAMPEPQLAPPAATLQDITWREDGAIGVLGFDFYNGGMNTSQARRLKAALEMARTRPVSVIVLAGGRRFWSTGMDLMAIEAAASAADESWASINAIDDVVETLIGMTDKLTVAALAGNAGAGGAFMALACDEVWAREGVVLNPHYKNMGNLYGSEYWTYLLPRRAGLSRLVVEARLPVGAREALSAGLLDVVMEGPRGDFTTWAHARARSLADAPDLAQRLADKRARRLADEAEKPLAAYRAEELARMREAFYGFDPSYHVARYHFIAKSPASRTPLHLKRPAA